jgi:hypothetical protein
MQNAINDFDICMQRVRSLHAIYVSFGNLVTAAVDLSDMLRAEIVLAVSAMDYFIHQLTRMGMIECWAGRRAHTDAFNRFQLPIAVAKGVSDPAAFQQALEEEIRTKHSHLSFQFPDKIADAVRLFSDVKLWDEVAKELGVDSRIAKTTLALIIERRNKIAHEADIDPSYPAQRWPINAAMVERTFDDLEKIARAIFKVSV